MEFLVYDTSQNPEEVAPPTPEMMEEMGQFIAEATQAGVVVTTGALQPKGTRLRLAGGKAAEAPLAMVKGMHGRGEIRRAEVGPHAGREDELRVRAFPQQEVAEALLAAGAHEEIDVQRRGAAMIRDREEPDERLAA